MPQSISSFTATFTYTVPSGGAADGFDFVVQNDPNGTSAIGGGGGARGYTGIANSAALGAEIYGGGNSNILINGNEQDSGVFNVATGDPISVRVNYSSVTQTISETLTDPVTHQSAYASENGVNLTSVVGGSTALVGFSGATGGASATQSISNFTFTNTAATSGKVYAPIAITSASFNQAMIIPAGAPTSGAASSITATMDAGTAKTGATFYETGYDPSNTLGTGVPTSGSTFVSQADANHTFQMQSYAGNDAVLLNSNSPSATMTFSKPAAMAALSFLTATGNGDNGAGPFSLTINYADGAPSTTIPYDVISPDWFFNGPVAWDANGRGYVDAVNATTYDNVNNGEPNFYEVDVQLPDSIDPIGSLTLNYDDSKTSSEVAIFAVSGSPTAVPEPASLGLITAAAVGLVGRRRRAR